MKKGEKEVKDQERRRKWKEGNEKSA